MTDGMELPNQEKIRMLREKEMYKYFGLLEADTIKQEMKKLSKRKLTEILIVVDAPGTAFKGFEKRLKGLEIRGRTKIFVKIG